MQRCESEGGMIQIRLFGRFAAQVGEEALLGRSSSKVHELLAYLLLHRGRPHSREVLATVLWGDTETWRAKKYLRQALWQLQAALRPLGRVGQDLLCIEPAWIELRPVDELQLDVAVLEAAAASINTSGAREALDAEALQRLRAAVDVYENDLLPGWYQEWCSFERERLQALYLTVLDVLMAHCEANGRGEEGLRYGALSLRYDRARERTHQRIMRLYTMSGDRAAALRQFDRCVIAMDEELGVAPATETRALYEQIRSGRPETPVLKHLPIAT